MAVLFRPEAIWFIVALVAASRCLLAAPARERMELTLIMGLLTVAPSSCTCVRHFGALVPPHISTNTSVIASDWLASRWALFPALVRR